MKQKKAHASHPVGNRTVIGIICIVVALAICFGIAPLVNRLSDGKTKIVRLTRDIPAGTTITEADIEVVDVGSYNLPTGVIKDKAQVVGKSALSSLSKGDYLFPSKIGADTNNAGRMLESLDENHKAISITIGSFALGFSGKLETGDIPESCSRILYELKIQQASDKRHSQGVWLDSGFVFTDKYGKNISLYAPTRICAEVQAKYGLRHLKLHGLRHTCGSLMVEHGVDPETVKTVLGHESLKTTNRYLHPYAESMKDASEKMERIIRGKADGETPIHLSGGE